MFSIMLRGLAVGMIETVPGISGSTVAMILGLYERLIYSFSVLTTKKRKEVIPFLLTFGAGMVIGFGISVTIIYYLLSTYRVPTMMFFAGIIVGFLPYLWKEAEQRANHRLTTKHFGIIALFLLIIFAFQALGGTTTMDPANLSGTDYLFFVTSGFIASTALVLPGISGALILTILGVYETAISSLAEMNLPVILTLGAGGCLGVLFTSKLIRYMLIHYSSETYAAMIGLVTGSIFVIFTSIPWSFDITMLVTSFFTFTAGAFIVRTISNLKTSHAH
ncbi:DUF368 domain-containing protein [Alteribacter aurantiacus]|uniref:DUF368 domain-containing protein n=1 Tax=Alteribacter aurantiacus TaxID=254410 RepID=UPI0004155039|nr:DUF368 domain-containing protein [Alteribacter aurantiacus]